MLLIMNFCEIKVIKNSIENTLWKINFAHD